MESDTKSPTHLDVMKYIADEYYDAAYPYVISIRQNITSDKIDNLLSEYSETELPSVKNTCVIPNLRPINPFIVYLPKV